ncbi:regulator of G-protein signaling 2 [Danio aesculapii]|uniref:regulator of G-protein signaling 2 n=1 Tax=Danio aesculapii TaxID=1142201 RepID=UPI0024C02600|nr:regulator of G-protein signaling 2 [Danio aesculapii]
MDRLTKMRTASPDSSMERLINLRNSEETEQSQIKKKIWWPRIFFNTLPIRESQHTTPQGKSYVPTTEELSQWAQSLDNLLSSKCGLYFFRLFMKSEHCEENLDFWLACEEFRKIRSRSKLKSKAKSIFNEFITPDSPKEINLDFNMKELLQQSIHIPTQCTFKAAQHRVLYLMEHNSYLRFLESELYQQLCSFAEGKQ